MKDAVVVCASRRKSAVLLALAFAGVGCSSTGETPLGAAGSNSGGAGGSAGAGTLLAGAAGIPDVATMAGSSADAGTGGGGGGSGGEQAGGGQAGAGQAGGGQAGGGAVDSGKVLYIAGAMPMVGLDLQIHDVLKARNMDVEDIRESAASPSNAQGKQLIVVSYSILSTDFKAADFADVGVPLIVMEDQVLATLGMTAVGGFGGQDGVTQITITSNEPTLAAGLPMGDVTVYSSETEVFWGAPGPGALKIAAVKGDPTRVVTYAYPTGSMMVGRVAPAKRLQLFVAGHAPPPNPKPFLNADGLKLVDAAVAWSTL